MPRVLPSRKNFCGHFVG
uniref:Uncharacterized protein n=1 Tax=Anguilla anguilla TaxID=7936 RepID=A0A0E9VFY6_ANGAN